MGKNCLGCFLWEIKHIPKLTLFLAGGLQRALLGTQEYLQPLLTINAFRKTSVSLGCYLIFLCPAASWSQLGAISVLSLSMNLPWMPKCRNGSGA